MIRSFIEPLSRASADLRQALKSGQTARFIALLRSDEELATADRDLLADLLSGELGRRVGRQNLKAPAKDPRRAAVARYRELRAADPRARKEDVAQAVANEFDFSLDQVLSLLKKGAP